MSLDWGYRCPVHDVETDHWLNHGERELRAAWLDRDALLRINSTLNIIFPWWLHEAIDFLKEHSKCPVELRNEHGKSEPMDVST